MFSAPAIDFLKAARKIERTCKYICDQVGQEMFTGSS